MDKGGGIALLLSKEKPKMDEKPAEKDSEGYGKGKAASAKAILSAIESKDSDALASALEDYISMC